jgi:hypothetical protein
MRTVPSVPAISICMLDPTNEGAGLSFRTANVALITVQIRVERLSPRAAFLELVKHTFNYRVVDTDRFERQFTETAPIAAVARIKKQFYPRLALQLLKQHIVLNSNVRGELVESPSQFFCI